jgi:NAD(P)-dependent dehydrogenase (short-subunit alcohol dehydrogenase family)
MFSLKGKVALVTGGTSGIGRAVATHFSREGARVAILGRRDGDGIAEEMNAIFVRCDVAEDASVAAAFEQVVERLGPLDVVILNAGADNTGPMIADHPTEAIRPLFAVNVDGVYAGLRHGQRLINDGGSIIITSSAAGLLTLPTYAQYSASKAAANSLARTAALELAPRRIRVNAVCPGGINTAMMYPDHPEYAIIRTITPLGRIGETDDLLGIYQFLASDASRYVSGQSIAVDGAATAGIPLAVLGLASGG